MCIRDRTKPEPVKKLSVAAAPAEDNSVDPPAKQVSVSASERLKQLAAATRIQKTPEQAEEQAPDIIKMSKAQRRKLRKQQKKQNRAA